MRAQNGDWGPARPTTYRGTPMRSRLEASWAAAFDNHDLRWKYEPRAFADQTGQYLPDFYLEDRGLWLEIKPVYIRETICIGDFPSREARLCFDPEHPLLRRMEIIWSSHPGDRLALMCGRTDDDDAVAFRTDDDHQWWWTSNVNYIWTPDPAGRR